MDLVALAPQTELLLAAPGHASDHCHEDPAGRRIRGTQSAVRGKDDHDAVGPGFELIRNGPPRAPLPSADSLALIPCRGIPGEMSVI